MKKDSIRFETVTPAIAEQWLNMNKINRKLRDGLVERFTADMKRLLWTQCMAPIVFYEDGSLADGQHRLWAIIESGMEQQFIIVRNLPKGAGLNIDTGLIRTLVDNAHISGAAVEISNELLATARAINDGARAGLDGRPRSAAEKLEILERHREASTWVLKCGLRGRFIRNQLVMGAVGRAWYVELDKNKLRRFCDVLSKGFADGHHESAAISARNFLQSNGLSATSTALWTDTFCRIQNAILHFMRGKPLTVLKYVMGESYPLGQREMKTLAATRAARELAASSIPPKRGVKKRVPGRKFARQQCIDDLRLYIAANGDHAPIRQRFIDAGRTGRSYERKFKSWDSFVAAANRS